MKISIEIEVPGLEQKLREARGDRSLQTIGEIAGISHQNVKLVEGTRSDRPNPVVPLETVLRVAGAVDVDVKEAIALALEKSAKKINYHQPMDLSNTIYIVLSQENEILKVFHSLKRVEKFKADRPNWSCHVVTWQLDD